MNKNVEIYIDRIVLDGFSHLNRADLNAAVHQHLTTVIAEQGLPDGLLNKTYHRKMDGGEMNLSPRPDTGQMGSDIAAGIFNGMNSGV